ncbi:hypothetical protein [Roseomonas chloroacetimidivorans]|uniref:hypothetical protein n=1 Tax=Roseomonas chloroacetimidivorans TaxID=1766656 RepID=UPI003C7765AD
MSDAVERRSNGRRAEVSEVEIIEAGQKLLDAGKPVNGWSLRRMVGDRGRPARLDAVWAKHAETQRHAAPQDAGEAEVTLPPGVAEMAAQLQEALSANVNGLIVQTFRYVENDLKKRYHEDFERLTKERAENKAKLKEAEDSIEATDAATRTLEQQVADLRDNLTAAGRENAALQSDIRKLETDRRTLTGEVSALKAQLSGFERAVQEAQQAAAVAAVRTQNAEEEAARLRQQLQDAAVKAEAATESKLAAAQDATAAKTELKSALADVDRLRHERAEASRHIEELVSRASSAEAQASAAEARASAAEARAAAADARAIMLEETLRRPVTSDVEQQAGDVPAAPKKAGSKSAGVASR